MSARKQRSIKFLAIEGMELYGVDGGNICVTCVPIGPDEVRQPKFGFMCNAEKLRDMAAGLLRLAEVVAKREAKP